MEISTVAAIIMGILQLFMGIIMALIGLLVNNLMKQQAALQVEVTNLRVAAMPRDEFIKALAKSDSEFSDFRKESARDRHRLRNIVNGLCVKIGYVPPQTQEDII